MADHKPERRGLGRGLSALIGDVTEAESDGGDGAAPARPDTLVPIEALRPNPDQPRRQFRREDLDELAASIREKGVLQPLIVRKDTAKPNSYEIVAGERRWRAAQIAQVHELPVIVRDYTDTEVLEIAMIENVQRADLNPIEEAAGYRQLIDRFGHTQEQLAAALSKSRSHIANLLRLLQLPEAVQEMLRDGRLTMGHARALITAPDPVALAREVVARGLSVRQTERLAAKPASADKPHRAAPGRAKDADTRALEGDLSAATGKKVEIEAAADGSGRVVIRYRNLDELDDICRLLSRPGGAD